MFISAGATITIAAEESIVIQDFEKSFDLSAWPPDTGKVEFSADWAANGKKSLKIYKGTMAAISDITTHDWSAYQVWRIHVRNPGKEGVNIGIELADEVNGYNNRHQNSASAVPGDSVIEIDIGGDLWRGERNKPYRENKTPIHKNKINRFAINGLNGDIYVDRIELAKVRRLECAGAFAFDLGGPGQAVQSQWIGIDPSVRWDDAKGYGITPGATALKTSTPYPTFVMGDGLTMNRSALEVNLGGGKHIGWGIFERSGFWEGEQAVYTKAALLANGREVHSHSAQKDDAWFLLQDVEAVTQDDVTHKTVLPRQKVADFAFDAVKGKNSFTLTVEGAEGQPARLAGLVLAPDTEAGRAFIADHKRLQLDTVAKTHQVLKKERRDGNPADARNPLTIVPLPSDHAMFPRDWPAVAADLSIPPLTAFAGVTVCRLLGVYAANDVEVSARCQPFKSGEDSLTDSAVRLLWNNYMPTHDYDVTAVHIETHDYRPAATVRATPNLARSLLIMVDIPKDTKPGKYTGSITISCTGAIGAGIRTPLVINVLAGTLPHLDWPTGLFFSGIPVPRHLLTDQDYWRLSEDLFRLLEQGSKTMLTAGPDYRLTPSKVEGADAVRYLKLAANYGLDRKVVTYGGFGMHGDLNDPAVGRAWEAFRTANGLPEHYVNAFDEPSLAQDFPPIEAKLRKMRAAGFKTIGWTSVSEPSKADSNHRMLVRESHAAAFNLHSPATLKWANQLGNEAWVYNNGLSRYDQGIHLWRNRRAGANGRVDWIASIVQGFQYDAMDSREPDLSCFYFHKKHGVLIAPRFLGVLEGGIDARLLSELERRAKKDASAPPAARINALLNEIESQPYRKELSLQELEKLRERMLVLFGAE